MGDEIIFNAKYTLKHDVRNMCSNTEVVKSEYLFGDDFSLTVKEARQTSKISATTISTSTTIKQDKNSKSENRSRHNSTSTKRFFHKGKNPTQQHHKNYKKSN